MKSSGRWCTKTSRAAIVLIVFYQLSYGYSTVCITPFLQMNEESWTIQYSDIEFSVLQGILTSVAMVGSLVGGTFGWLVCDRFGRKKPTVIGAMIQATSLSLRAFAQIPELGAWWLGLFDFIGGVVTGATGTAIPVYAQELIIPELRGKLSLMVQIMTSLGLVVGYAVCGLVQSTGPFSEGCNNIGCDNYSWLPMVLNGIWTLPIIFLGKWLPESQIWIKEHERLTNKMSAQQKAGGLLEAAESGLSFESNSTEQSVPSQWRKTDEARDVLLEQHISSNIGDHSISAHSVNPDNDGHESSEMILDPKGNEKEDILPEDYIPDISWKVIFRDYTRCVILGIIMTVCNQLTGINPLIVYAPTIFADGGLSEDLSSLLGGVGVTGWNTIVTVLGLFIIDKMGRKTLLLIGFSITTFALLVLWVSEVWITQADPEGTTKYSFPIMVVALVIFLFGYEIGPGPLFYVLLSEAFPTEIKARMLGFFNIVTGIIVTLCVLTFPYLHDTIGGWIWAIYGFTSALAIPFTAFLAVETRGVNLEDVHKIMYRPRKSKKSGAD